MSDKQIKEANNFKEFEQIHLEEMEKLNNINFPDEPVMNDNLPEEPTYPDDNYYGGYGFNNPDFHYDMERERK